MDLFDLEQNEIQILFERCRDNSPTQIQITLNVSSGEFFDRQSKALDKLEIPGEGKERFPAFRSKGLCRIVLKLTREDIENWYERREDLRKKLLPPGPSPTTNEAKEKPTRELRQWIDNVRQWLDKNRQYRWLPVAGVLFFILLVGVFLWGRGTASPVVTSVPTQEIASNPTSLPPSGVLPTETQALALTATITLTPSITPTPSNTATATNTPLPTDTQVPTPAPLFFDDFSGGMKDEWKSPVYGDVPFIAEGGLKFRSTTMILIGSSDWTDYEVSFDVWGMSCQAQWVSDGITTGLRVQDASNMVAMEWVHWGTNCRPSWFIVTNGTRELIFEHAFDLPPKDAQEKRHLAVRVQGNTYTTPFGGEITIDNFPSGGIAVIADVNVIIDNFKVTLLSP